MRFPSSKTKKRERQRRRKPSGTLCFSPCLSRLSSLKEMDCVLHGSSSSSSLELHRTVVSSMVQSVVAEVALLALSSLLLLHIMKISLPDDLDLISNWIATDKRFPFSEINRQEKPTDKNKDAGESGESETDEDDDEDDDDDDQGDDGSSGEEGSNDDVDSDAEANGEGESSSDDSDEDEDEDEEEDDDDDDDGEEEVRKAEPPSKKQK